MPPFLAIRLWRSAGVIHAKKGSSNVVGGLHPWAGEVGEGSHPATRHTPALHRSFLPSSHLLFSCPLLVPFSGLHFHQCCLRVTTAATSSGWTMETASSSSDASKNSELPNTQKTGSCARMIVHENIKLQLLLLKQCF